MVEEQGGDNWIFCQDLSPTFIHNLRNFLLLNSTMQSSVSSGKFWPVGPRAVWAWDQPVPSPGGRSCPGGSPWSSGVLSWRGGLCREDVYFWFKVIKIRFWIMLITLAILIICFRFKNMPNHTSIGRTHYGPLVYSEDLSEISFYLPNNWVFARDLDSFMFKNETVKYLISQ